MTVSQIVKVALVTMMMTSCVVYLALYQDSSRHQKLVDKFLWTKQNIGRSLFELLDHKQQDQFVETTDATPNTESQTMCSQEERRQIFRDTCERYHPGVGRGTKLTGLKGLLVDERHQLVYCGAAKGGSTAWLNLLIKASGKVRSNRRLIVHSDKVLRAHGLKRIASYNDTQKRHILDTDFKFIVVRHPIERVVSAWRDKFIMPDGPYKKLGKRIAAKYQKGRNAEQNSTNKDGYWDTRALFVEFARHLAETHHRDHHWASYKRVCNPCAVDWDAVVKVETTQQDSALTIFPKFGKDINTTSLPVIHSHQDRSTLNHFVKNLPEMSFIPPEVLQYLYSEYGQDMDLFGYHWNQTSLVAACGSLNSCC